MLERIDAAAAAGFRAVELHWPYDIPTGVLRERLHSNGVILLGINTPVGSRPGDFGLAALPGREAEFREGFRQSLDYAVASGASAIHVMAGVPAPEQLARSRETFLANLAFAAPLAGREDITLLLEPINRKDRPGYFYDRIGEASAILREIGSPALRIMFDFYHVGTTEGAVLPIFEAHLGEIRHVQFASVPHRGEPDEGEIDYRAVFAAIDRLGYAGWVGAEYKPRGRTEDGLGYLHWA